MDLVCVGDVMVDVHVAAGALARGGDVHGHVRIAPGGASANAAVWAAWAGAGTAVIAAVGDDFGGAVMVEELERRGVDVGGIVRRGDRTGSMLIVTEAGDRSMVADRGASASLVADDLPHAIEAGAVLVSGYLMLQEPTTAVAREAVSRSSARFVAVEAASWPLVEGVGRARFDELAAGATAVLANDREAEALTGETGARACGLLGERYPIAAVKRGARGAALCVDGTVLEWPADPVQEVDPTGAGDAFDGVLLARLARGDEPAEALAAACRAGALVAASELTWPEGDA